jgi:flagellar biosynthesis protein FliP
MSARAPLRHTDSNRHPALRSGWIPAFAGLTLIKRVLPLLLFAPAGAFAATGIPVVTVEGQSYSLTIQMLLLMTAITFLPAILLMMTSFTRIVIVLALLRQALGAGTSPPNQVLVGLSLFLTLFVMGPVVDKINTQAVQPYMAGSIDTTAAMEKGVAPLKQFMLEQTRESDIATFVRIAGEQGYQSPQDVPLRILVPSFATSELKSAFQIGFMVFIPFVIIDLVVASVLMSMGMMMLSPMIISLPFKIMLFVLVDGWSLTMSTLAQSFYR